MFRTTFALALLLVTPAGQAQTTASATVRTGCTAPAPADSLVARPLSPLVYVPNALGVVNMEIESIPAFGNWVQESTLAGYRGDGYFRWAGANQFGSPGVDTLTFRFLIESADTYLVRLRNQHNNPDPTADNDCWFRIDGGPWIKLVDSWGSGGVNVWSFNAFLETTGAFPQYALSPGVHVVELSGRSMNFKLDSLHVLPLSVWFANTTDPQSDVRRSRPVLGTVFRMEIDDPTNAGGFTPGATQVLLGAGPAHPAYPCGPVLPGVGEILLSLSPAPLFFGPALWNGPGQPIAAAVPVPNLPGLDSLALSLQGVFLEPGHFGLTDALDVVLGTQ